MHMHIERRGEKTFCLGLTGVFMVVLVSFVLMHPGVPLPCPASWQGLVVTRGTPRTWGVVDQQAGALRGCALAL